MNVSVCPKCQYQRRPSDSQVHQGLCPRCGIAYAKYRVEDPAIETPSAVKQAPAVIGVDNEEIATGIGIGQRLLNTLTYIPDRVDPGIFWGRVALLVLFALWGGSFIVSGVDWESIGGSFLHNINLPFHEFGHVLFGFFGRFMAILGGSLFQVIFPLVFVAAFSFQRRDNFAAAICLWWSGQNFIDVSPYIADAKYRAIPLIRGLGEEYHDWGNLLTMTNSLDSATALANASFALGSLIILLSLSWGGWLLWKQHRCLETFQD